MLPAAPVTRISRGEFVVVIMTIENMCTKHKPTGDYIRLQKRMLHLNESPSV